MDLAFLQEYMVPVIVGICLCIGYLFKKWQPDEQNKFIPTICAACGIILAWWINGKMTPVILLQGLFSGLAATGLHQVFKQLIEKGEAE